MRLGNHGTTTHPILEGDQAISGHRLIRCRGRGGVADIWEAESPTGDRVALKLVHLAAGLHSGELRALEVMRQVRHPSLLEILGTWQVDDLLVISMELADRSLWDRFVEARNAGLRGIPLQELLGYLGPVAEAVDYLNEYQHAVAGRQGVGIQHRDLKPQNIMLVGDDAKVADFGLARVMEQSVVSHTGPCTLPYAAPEYFRGRTSHGSDQYALAVTYCQLRGGRVPFTGTTAQITFGHLFKDPNLTSLPDPERPIVARALAKWPEQRWPDCRSFVAALRALPSTPGGAIPECLPRTPRDDRAEPDATGFTSEEACFDRAVPAADGDRTPRDGPGLEALRDAFEGRDDSGGGWTARAGSVYADSDRVEIRMDSARSAPPQRRPGRGEIARQPPALGMTRVRPKWSRVAQAAGIAAVLALALVSPAVIFQPVGRHPTPRASHASDRQTTVVRVATRTVAPPAVVAPEPNTVTTPERPRAATQAANAACLLPALLRAHSATAIAAHAPRVDEPQRTGWDLPISQVWGIRETEAGAPTAAEIYRAWGLAVLLPARPEQSPGASGGSTAVEADRLGVPAAVTVVAGQTTRLRLRVPRGHTPMPLHLEFRKLPPGISMDPSAVTLGTDTVDLVLSASDQAPSGSAEASVVCVVGTRSDEARFVVNVLR
jgi:hypothetical protein